MENNLYLLTFLRPSLLTRAAPIKTPGRAIVPNINWYCAVCFSRAGPVTPLRMLAIMVDETENVRISTITNT